LGMSVFTKSSTVNKNDDVALTTIGRRKSILAAFKTQQTSIF
jgi:hypothetical protein